MKSLLIVFLLLMQILLIQAYTIGNYSKTFYDASRNRNIPTQIFYPIDQANPSETFPYIVFGHGWLMSYSYTQVLTDNLVQLGWIVALPTTEGGLFPSHLNFALDLAFLQGAMLTENNNPTSVLFNKIEPLAVVGGYSMSGGSAILAASDNQNFVSVITFAAAETNPSAISAAPSVTVPTLTFSGSSDNIAPPASHQIPMYNNLSSDYKAHVTLTGATHTNVFSRSQVSLILNPWLNYLKTGSIYYLDLFEAVLTANLNALTYNLVNDLVVTLDPPSNLTFELDRGMLIIAWDRLMEAHGYRIYASEHPDQEYQDISDSGTFSVGSRMYWFQTPGESNRKFYYLTAFRN